VEGSQEAAAAQVAAAQQEAARHASAARDAQAARDAEARKLECQICFERPRDTVLLPCMHFFACSKCVEASRAGSGGAAAGGGAAAAAAADPPVHRCPVCRAHVAGQVVVHLTGQ
jgi:hypothetical protein